MTDPKPIFTTGEEQPVEITLGALYDVKTDDGGRFVAKADRFERDGNVVVLIPVRDPVRDVFPLGYRLGSVHWPACLNRLEGGAV
jgi:hypothetical protein